MDSGEVHREKPLHFTSLPKKQGKNRLLKPTSRSIGAPLVAKLTLPLTIICGCALALSAQAAQPDSLHFKTQTVFDRQNDKAKSEPVTFEFKERTAKDLPKATTQKEPKLGSEDQPKASEDHAKSAANQAKATKDDAKLAENQAKAPTKDGAK